MNSTVARETKESPAHDLRAGQFHLPPNPCLSSSALHLPFGLSPKDLEDFGLLHCSYPLLAILVKTIFSDSVPQNPNLCATLPSLWRTFRDITKCIDVVNGGRETCKLRKRNSTLRGKEKTKRVHRSHNRKAFPGD